MLSDIDSLVRWSACLFLCTLLYFFNQLPARYGIKIDCDMFMRCITYLRDKQRVQLGPWVNGPGWRSEGAPDNPPPFEPYEGDILVSQDRRRAGKWREWERFYNKMSSHIPRAVTKPGKPDKKPYSDLEELDFVEEEEGVCEDEDLNEGDDFDEEDIVEEDEDDGEEVNEEEDDMDVVPGTDEYQISGDDDDTGTINGLNVHYGVSLC